MPSLYDFLTTTEKIQQIESDMAESADDLLVEAGKEKKRTERIIGQTAYGMGMLVRIQEDPRIKFKLEVYPNEVEEPHFKVTYQNTTCRFKILDCTPMKAETARGIPPQIKKIMKEIRKTWKKNYKNLVKIWMDTRPNDKLLGHQKIR